MSRLILFFDKIDVDSSIMLCFDLIEFIYVFLCASVLLGGGGVMSLYSLSPLSFYL